MIMIFLNIGYPKNTKYLMGCGTVWIQNSETNKFLDYWFGFLEFCGISLYIIIKQ